VPGVMSFVLSGWTAPGAFFHSVDQFWVIVCWMVSVPHLAASLTLFLRWGAVPLAFATTLGALFCSEWLCHEVFHVYNMHDFGLYFVCPSYSALCVACHVLILRRLPAMAAR
jgi:hypothetical protein